jgi:hypothetical protein
MSKHTWAKLIHSALHREMSQWRLGEIKQAVLNHHRDDVELRNAIYRVRATAPSYIEDEEFRWAMVNLANACDRHFDLSGRGESEAGQ